MPSSHVLEGSQRLARTWTITAMTSSSSSPVSKSAVPYLIPALYPFRIGARECPGKGTCVPERGLPLARSCRSRMRGMRRTLFCGEGTLEADLPDSTRILRAPASLTPLDDPGAAVREALSNPVAHEPL